MNSYEQFNETRMELLIQSVVKNTVKSLKESFVDSEWMSLKDAGKYLNVSPNTFKKYRLQGLKIAEIDGVKRVSKKELDRFMKENSF